jgi:DNA-binding XRE family transcriptional regulator
MLTIITGDIVNSRSVTPEVWLNPLKELLTEISYSENDWDIFRGDSFQVSVQAKDAFRIAVLIKTVIKMNSSNKIDVRMAVGIGENDSRVDKVSEATGQAFEYSGELLDNLTQVDVHLGIKTPWKEIDEEFNMMFKLALIVLNSWTVNTSEVAHELFKNPGITQTELAKKFDLAQSTINARIKRGSVYEIIELETYFRKRISEKIETHYGAI